MCKLAWILGAVIVLATANRVAGQTTATCRPADAVDLAGPAPAMDLIRVEYDIERAARGIVDA
ncbi:MAG: hypothetical protein ABIV11_02755 [Gemmatimonadaceae bacterium]